MPSFVDLHAHYLAGLDDGAIDLATTVQMVEGVRGLGFSHLFATPHQRTGLFLPTKEAIAGAFQAMKDAFPGPNAPRFGLGAENFWDDTLLGRMKEKAIPCYDDGPAFLFEVTPQLMPSGIENALFDLRLAGKLPVMAHPERYAAIQRNIDRAQALGQTAALVIDLAALDGAHGRGAMLASRQLVLGGFVHAAATDIHRPDDVPAIAAGIAWIRKHLGAAALETLLSENPRRILAGDLPERTL